MADFEALAVVPVVVGDVPPVGSQYEFMEKSEPVAEVVTAETLTPEITFRNSGRLLVALSSK